MRKAKGAKAGGNSAARATLKASAALCCCYSSSSHTHPPPQVPSNKCPHMHWHSTSSLLHHLAFHNSRTAKNGMTLLLAPFPPTWHALVWWWFNKHEYPTLLGISNKHEYPTPLAISNKHEYTLLAISSSRRQRSFPLPPADAAACPFLCNRHFCVLDCHPHPSQASFVRNVAPKTHRQWPGLGGSTRAAWLRTPPSERSAVLEVFLVAAEPLHDVAIRELRLTGDARGK